MSAIRFALPVSLGLLLGPKAFAEEPAVISPAPQVAARPVAAHEVGRTTRDLLRLQVSGAAAGKKLPLLGDAASASYKRYIDSFKHALPEHFEEAVKAQDSN